MPRKRHQDKEIEKTLRLAEGQGWRVEIPPKGYMKIKCPCEDKHYRTVHSTPSDSNYNRNLLGWLKRQSCWTKEEPQ